MSIALRVGPELYSIGTSDFLYSFFSTILVRLENGQRGSRFPRLRDLYVSGRLEAAHAAAARTELAMVREGFKAFSPNEIVWDADNRSLLPPWGTKIANTITSLENYFWTDDGKPLFESLGAALAASQASGQALEIT